MLALDLQPVPAGAELEAFLLAARAVAQYYGVQFNPEGELPEGYRTRATELAKAIPAHHSHYQTRSGGGQFVRRAPYHNIPRTDQGRFTKRLTAAERDAAADTARGYAAELRERLQDHLADVTRNAITPAQWYTRCERELRHYYDLLYRCGKQAAGDPAVFISPQDRAALNRLLLDELDYLRGFQQAQEAGEGRMPYPQRMGMYADAVWESFWLGWVLGDQRTGRQVRWRYGPTKEHCGLADGGSATGCSDFVALGWTPIRDFVREVLSKGFLPRSGSLECKGSRCQCYLEERGAGRVSGAFSYGGA